MSTTDTFLRPAGVGVGVAAGRPLGDLQAVDGGADVPLPLLLQGSTQGEVAVGVGRVQLRGLGVGNVRFGVIPSLLGPTLIETFWLEFWLEKRIEIPSVLILRPV